MEGLFEMAFTYSVTLNLTDKPCLVVGGGQVALRKALSLLEEGAFVSVVSPEVVEELDLLSQEGRLTWHQAPYDDSFIAGKFLVIAATDQRAVNQRAAQDCHDSGILVNVADNREASSFIVNACVKQGDLLLAVSTSGVSPAIARRIKMELSEQYGPEYGQLLAIIKQARAEAMRTIQDAQKRRLFLQSLAEMDLVKELKQTSEEDVRKRVMTCLSSYWD